MILITENSTIKFWQIHDSMGEVHQNITGNEYADQIAMLELAHTKII